MAVHLPVVIDRTSPTPLYHQLAEQFTAMITDGVLKPGDPFENEISLAERLELSRPTVRRAISELVAEGLLTRRRGVGTTVATHPVHRRDRLTSLHDDLLRTGRHPQTSVLDLRTDVIDERAAEALGRAPDTPLVFVRRLRSTEEGPLAVLRNWLPPEFADLTVDELTRTGLYDVLRTRGHPPEVGHQTIGARAATSVERRLLRLGRIDPVLTMIGHAHDGTGAVVEFGDHCYRADQYALDVTVHGQ
ncbi:GntR family transcriptional regulator [Mobilicoccus sp.]|uniref:GntR family transcriptional regulator n=1 Tax=Mobilicoccus sp. TaxID=2034349 RepID=UPI0028979A88|nr:GntR family transcriptional regulator [Mobilicoccus sp.]